MIGSQDAPHRIEQGIMRVYDASSPITKPIGGKALNFKEEYYRFNVDGPKRLRWDAVHVLLTVDLDDPKVEPRPWPGYTRPDKIYPVSWIRTYGKGRVFYSSLGHGAEMWDNRDIAQMYFEAIKWSLGLTEGDATPRPLFIEK